MLSLGYPYAPFDPGVVGDRTTPHIEFFTKRDVRTNIRTSVQTSVQKH